MIASDYGSEITNCHSHEKPIAFIRFVLRFQRGIGSMVETKPVCSGFGEIYLRVRVDSALVPFARDYPSLWGSVLGFCSFTNLLKCFRYSYMLFYYWLGFVYFRECLSYVFVIL